MVDSDWLGDGFDELDAREYPDEYEDYDEYESTFPCPACGREIDEDAQLCPGCGTAVMHDTGIWTGRSRMWVVLGVLGIIAVILALTLGI